MTRGGRRTSIAIFIVLGSLLAAGAIALNVGWIIVSWQNVGLLVAGLVVFPLVIAGVVINTIFLVREIRRNEQHEAFINAMTHELKTPVASMRLYLQTLQNRQVDDAKRQDFYRVMLDDSDRLLGTIDQVLRAGQLGARRRRWSGHTVDLNSLASEYVSLARTRHRLEADALTYRSPHPSHLLVLGDEDELRAVVSNLVDNAIKYSGPQVRVDVELEQTDAATIALRVRDRGIGIPPSEQKRIFKRFYRIPGVKGRRVNGTGLGLFIVRSVVKRHGGRVYAESDGPGHGSTFVVQLPLAAS
ncbi:MAG TPA: HAMP domain-containing sensor histidine kinase [Vicinamibacterales bacterium]|nr:HAMP domain-containing sensor histidine kinase [Vicinamibacterales bacterium]